MAGRRYPPTQRAAAVRLATPPYHFAAQCALHGAVGGLAGRNGLHSSMQPRGDVNKCQFCLTFVRRFGKLPLQRKVNAK